uniref:Ig-like domain-containing protein n=1 Tax=Seriola lalandi dorsalis TaxID=1841481 RepID=A0A3B4YGB9_SERLL
TMTFNLVTALLFTCSWISVSVSEFHTVEVQSGEEVTLMCTNFTSSTSHIFWFRLDNRPNATCICSMSSSNASVTFCDGFQNGKFNMTSNITTLFLQIKQVDSSDSGLYFCGSYWNNWSIIVSATYLKVQESVELATLTCAILSALVIFLIIIVIVLGLKIRKLHTVTIYCHLQNPSSADVTYAALKFNSKLRKSSRPASKRGLELNETSGTAAQSGTGALSYQTAFEFFCAVSGWEELPLL